ncbi:MAG: hypothetical protein ABI921_13365, partial [Panacibacter sp.]
SEHWVRYFQINFPLIFFFCFLVSSCKRHSLSEESIKLIPYKGGETLYFRSDNDDIDSIELDKPDRYFYDAGTPMSGFSGEKMEIYEFGGSYSNPNSDTLTNSSYSINDILRLSASTNNKIYFDIHIQAKNASFEPFSGIEIEDYKHLKTSTLSIPYGTFTDVIYFYPVIDSTRSDYYMKDNDNFITKVYWSKSKGLLRYDKKECYWQLVDIKHK